MDRKQAARQLKNNPLLNEIFAARDAEIVDAWRSAQTLQERERCATDIRALESLRELTYARIENTLVGDDAGAGAAAPAAAD
jgi:hypothetical protein